MVKLCICESCGWEGNYVELILDEEHVPTYCPRCGEARVKMRSVMRATLYEPKKMINCEDCEWEGI